MFKIGFGEILIIGILAIVFINPKDLPGIMRKTGRLIGKLKTLRNEFEETSTLFKEEMERENRKTEDSEKNRNR